jgi:hypothetical protein
MILSFGVGNFSHLPLIDNGQRVDNLCAKKSPKYSKLGASFEDLVESNLLVKDGS